MSLTQVLRGTFQKLVGISSVSSTPTSFLTPTLNSWSIDFIRTKTRHHFARPNEAKRIKKHGWWTKMATREGLLTKAIGCRPISLIRYFSDAIKATKVKRKLNRNVNYCVPILSNDRKQSIEKIVSLQIFGQYLTCTTIVRQGNILTEWKMFHIPENMNKFHLDDVYNYVKILVKNIPKGDIYVIENYIKMPNNVSVAGANLFYVKLQTLAMLIALINSGQNDNSTIDNDESVNKVILMKARLHARLFKIIVGTEIISSQEITELMLKGTFPEYVTPIVPEIGAILSYNSVKDVVEKEQMSNCLMLAMTFIDLVLNSNPKSIQALNESSKRKLKC